MTEGRDAELAAAYASQSKRAAFAAFVVLVAGVLGSWAAAMHLSYRPVAHSRDGWEFVAVFGAGLVLTAVAYVAVSAMETHARARTIEHLALALDEEAATAE